MAKRRLVVTIGTLGLDRGVGVPLHRQLYEGLREAILSGRLRPGARLPSTRALAADLGASRNTVLAAFGQLLAEGYVEGRVGAGTTVAPTLPETLLRAHPEARAAERPGRRPAAVSPRGASRGHARRSRAGRRRGPPVPPRPAGARALPVRSVDASRRPAMAARAAPTPRLRRPGRLRAAPRGDCRVPPRGAGGALRGGAGDRRDGRPAGRGSRRPRAPRSRRHAPGSKIQATWARVGPSWRRASVSPRSPWTARGSTSDGAPDRRLERPAGLRHAVPPVPAWA